MLCHVWCAAAAAAAALTPHRPHTHRVIAARSPGTVRVRGRAAVSMLLPTSRAELVRLLNTPHASTRFSDTTWNALYGRMARRGELPGFGSVEPACPGAQTPPKPGVPDEYATLPITALSSQRGPSGVPGQRMQAILGCQWLFVAAVVYHAARDLSLTVGHLAPFSAGSVGMLAVAVEQLVLEGRYSRAALAALNGRYTERLARHEAGHFLMAYLMGLPVTAYRLIDVREPASTSFFHPELFAERQRGHVTDRALAQLSLVLMSGASAEVLEYGSAQGGSADERLFLATVRNARPEWSRARATEFAWASMSEAEQILQDHKTQLDALSRAMRANAPLGTCVAAIAGEMSEMTGQSQRAQAPGRAALAGRGGITIAHANVPAPSSRHHGPQGVSRHGHTAVPVMSTATQARRQTPPRTGSVASAKDGIVTGSVTQGTREHDLHSFCDTESADSR